MCACLLALLFVAQVTFYIDVVNSEHNWPCKAWKGEDGGVDADSDGTDRTDSEQGDRQLLIYHVFLLIYLSL